MKMIKRTLIILIIATTIFTVVKCNRIEDADNIKQEQGDDTLPKEEKEDKEEKEEDKKDNQGKEDENKDNEQDKNDEPKDDKEKEEIESPVELG